MLPLFDGNAVDFSVPFIVITGNMLGSEVENATYACLFQVLHFFQGPGIVNNLTEFSVTVFPFWKVGKNVSSGFVPIYYLNQVRIVVLCWIMIIIFSFPSDNNHTMTMLKYFIIRCNLLMSFHFISHLICNSSQVIKRFNHIHGLCRCNSHHVFKYKHFGTEMAYELEIIAIQIVAWVTFYILSHLCTAGN